MALYALSQESAGSGAGPRWVAKPSGGAASIQSNYSKNDSRYPKTSPLYQTSQSIQATPISNSGGGGGSKSINVISNFDWTASPSKNNIYKTLVKPPGIALIEHRIKASSLLSQAAYATLAAAGSVGALVQDVSNLISSDLAKSVAQGTSSISSAVNGLLGGGGGSGELQPYEYLYITEPTGFEYVLPFYSNEYRSKNNSFADSYAGAGNNPVANLAGAFADAAKNISIGIDVLRYPGIYVEQTKFFQAGNNSETLTFTFPLLNTLTKAGIEQNCQLIWLLAFQNSSYRRSRSVLDPPCIYEVILPGTRYIKYAYISNLKIEFAGTRRRVSVSMPGAGQIETIVPEAYNITITITSLTDESGNFMIHALGRNYPI